MLSNSSSRLGIVLSAVLALAACKSSGPSSGHEARDVLVGSVQNAGQELKAARRQLQLTLQSYNDITKKSAEDAVATYQEFSDNLQRSQKQVDVMVTTLRSMEKSADDYFSRWDKDFAEFADESLKKRSQEHMHTVRRKYGEVRSAMEPARARSGQFVASLRDQAQFLKYDLSPRAVSFLSGDAKLLNETAADLLASMKEAVDLTDQFAQSLEESRRATQNVGSADSGSADSGSADSTEQVRRGKRQNQSITPGAAPAEDARPVDETDRE